MFVRRAAIAAGGSAVALFAAVSVVKRREEPEATWPPIFTRRWDPNWDCNQNGKWSNGLKQACPAKATRIVFLVRHGHYHKAGHTESEKGLTAKGRAQAMLTGQRLKGLGYKYNTLIHSSMTRAKETADLISQQLHDPSVIKCSCDLLREGQPIQPDPPKDDRNPDVYKKDGPRIEKAFRKYFHRADPEETESYEIIVCHDNVIRYFVCRALQLPPEAWLRMSLYHGSITKLVIHHNGDVTLEMVGDVGFMPRENLSKHIHEN
ncbi:serine/threonine-protein phosphatase PGAM5, mitochondrial-like [Pelodytes ibericus]